MLGHVKAIGMLLYSMSSNPSVKRDGALTRVAQHFERYAPKGDD